MTVDVVAIYAMAAVASAAASLVFRRWWLVALVVTAAFAVGIVVHALAQNGFRARPSDVAFWLPMLAARAFALLLPVTFLAGLLAHLSRKWQRRR